MKKEYILLGVAIIGLGVLLFYQKKGRINYKLPELSVLEETADRLVLEKDSQLIELRLADGKWVIGAQQYRANTARVEKMIAEIKGLKLTALISERGNYQLYELTPEKKLKVMLFSADQLLRELQIGKNSASLQQTYVMIKDDPKVYQVLGNLKSNFFTTVAELRDKKVLEIAREKLAGLETIVLQQQVDGNNQILSMIKIKSEPVGGLKTDQVPVAGWQQESGLPVAAAAVAELLKNLSDLQCESFIEDRQGAAFSDPFYRIVVRGAGEEISLDLLVPEDGRYPALSSQSSDPFWLPGWRAEKIVKEFTVYTGPERKAGQ